VYCLNCGWCCEHMSPLTNSEYVPCPRLVERDGMKLCSDYEHRPDRCKTHEFLSKVCPVGRDVLGLNHAEAMQRVQQNDWKLYMRRW
jgi:Fe-S-cluster containining protein